MPLFPASAWLGILLTAGMTPSRPAPIFRWGVLGHRIVADLAETRLTPAVAAETRRLLGGQTITDVATWADEHRNEMPGTAPWHYVDIETMDSSYVAERDCKKDACIVAALQHEFAVLSDHAAGDSARATALRWVVHLAGDIEQPLHAGERGDRGGNDVKVTFNGRPTNLHSLWDTGLLVYYGNSEDEIVHALADSIAHRQDVDALAGGSFASWAMQSHDIARDVVYGKLPSTLEVTQQYADAARPVIYDQLLRGGVRLAALLNRALGH